MARTTGDLAISQRDEITRLQAENVSLRDQIEQLREAVIVFAHAYNSDNRPPARLLLLANQFMRLQQAQLPNHRGRLPTPFSARRFPWCPIIVFYAASDTLGPGSDTRNGHFM